MPQINCEIAVPLDRFNDAVRVLEEWYSETTHKLHYPFIFRCTKESWGLLAPHRGTPVCWIGFLVYLDAGGGACPGSFEMMREIQCALLPLGGTPHWGKHMCMDLYDWEAIYPEWHTFGRVVREMDPTGKFQNEWTRDLFKP